MEQEVLLVAEAWQHVWPQQGQMERAEGGVMARSLEELSQLMYQDTTPRAQYRAFRAIEMCEGGSMYFTRVAAPPPPPPSNRGSGGRGPPPSPPIVYEYLARQPPEVCISPLADERSRCAL